MKTCKTNTCDKGKRACPTPISCGMMTQSGGEFVDTRRKTFVPDFEIERTSVSYEMTFFGWCMAVIGVAAFVIGAYQFLGT